jgi:NAD(P)-dependent dehydrogenase (short-subunit alcohol dehydrogenase family)
MGLLDGKVAFIIGAPARPGAEPRGGAGPGRRGHHRRGHLPQSEAVPYPMATPEDLAVTVKEVEAIGRRIVASQVDVRDLAALTDAVEDGVAQLGRLDIVWRTPASRPSSRRWRWTSRYGTR